MQRLISFNVNGVRAIMKKDFVDDMRALNPDIICLQETKAQVTQVEEALKPFQGYYIVANEAERKGYSGTAILTKQEPLSVRYGIGAEIHDKEGRVITVEFATYFLVSVYVPNSGNGLKRLEYRASWDNEFRDFLIRLQNIKPVVLCGDLNVCHQSIDIARPKANYDKSAGYTQIEIDGMDAMMVAGFVDSFRYYHPEEVKYSWWSYRGGARQRNIGWRLDYFLVSESLLSKVKKSEILNEVMGSDHCPILLEMEV